MKIQLNHLILACLLGCLGVVQYAAAAPRVAPHHVAETFEVGENSFIRALTVEPKKNTLWVGSSVGVLEVDLASNQVRNTFTRSSGLANEYVFAIGIDKQGYKWFGTNAGGASRYRDGKWKTYFPMHGLADYWIYSFANQKNGDLWIGTWAGANKVDLRTMQFTTYVKELINEWVYGIAVDKRDRVWFATEGGISMFDGKKWESWTKEDGMGAANKDKLPASANTGLGTRSRHNLGVLAPDGTMSYNNNYTFAIMVTEDQSVWAGTWGGGVTRFDGKRWHNYTNKDGLAGNVVYSMVEGRDGVLWFGTNGGLSRFDGVSWHNYTEKTGLLDNNIYSVAVTPNGDVWAGSRHGVTRLAQ
ncbi:MAG: ligand-binding sensor domain-containing protein [Pseudomonadota bacterium]